MNTVVTKKLGIDFSMLDTKRFDCDNWEPQTFEILKSHLRPSDVYLDLGAWIGPTVLFAAQLCREVHAVEPDAVARWELKRNLQLNPTIKNVVVYSAAISDTNGESDLVQVGCWGNSMSRLGGSGIPVDTLTLMTFVQRNNVMPDFIKIDVEGSEEQILTAASGWLEQYRPVLYLSFHVPYTTVEFPAWVDRQFRGWDILESTSGQNVAGALPGLAKSRDFFECLLLPPN